MFARTTLQTLLVKTYSYFLQSVSTCKLLPILKANILKKVFRRLEVCLEPCYTAQKMKFSIRISSVNVTKSAGICGFGRIYWRKPQWKTSFLCSVKDLWWQKSSIVDVWLGAKYNSKTITCFRKKKKKQYMLDRSINRHLRTPAFWIVFFWQKRFYCQRK